MDKDQFLKFRMALLPSSGFQSVQYRLIELYSTDLDNLVGEENKDLGVEDMFESIYWKRGATELSSGKKTLTLSHFEEKYSAFLTKKAKKLRDANLNQKLKQCSGDSEQMEALREALKRMDQLVNVDWALVHYKSAVRYLQKDPEDIAATGGTNWQKYLPPKFQGIVFFPDIWTGEEKKDWGKSWVMKEVFNR